MSMKRRITSKLGRGSGRDLTLRGADGAGGGGALPPGSGPMLPDPRGVPEELNLRVEGSRQGVNHLIQRLHLLGFVEQVKWSTPVPTKEPNQYMSILHYRVWLS